LAAQARYQGPHLGTEPIEVSVVLRRKGTPPPPVGWPRQRVLRRADFNDTYGADPADVARLRDFAHEHALQETGCEMHRRVLNLRGTPQALQQAFGVELGRYQASDDAAPVLGVRAPPRLPDAIAPAVIAVLGLDRRPVARPHFLRPLAQPGASYTPAQLGRLYGFPAGLDGSGQSIAVIELGGGFSQDDFEQYCTVTLGLAQAPSVTIVPVAGGQNRPGDPADVEVMLDAEVIGALAPGATIVIYVAPNTDQGFYEAISQAAHDTRYRPSVISISWGGPEDSWSAAALRAMESVLQDAAALGVTVTAAAGDGGDGEGDGRPHVDYPASSVYALACGGTRLDADGSGIVSEVVWNESATNEGATGGGISASYARPGWQLGAKVPAAPDGFAGRGVPDVAGNADPLTGYRVRVDGTDQVVGGTSAVAPLWAALIACCNQSLGSALGDPHAAFYGIDRSAFRDITRGDNGAYAAATGWDACTGLGSPDGDALLGALVALQGGT
jgi:kumamolisin